MYYAVTLFVGGCVTPPNLPEMVNASVLLMLGMSMAAIFQAKLTAIVTPPISDHNIVEVQVKPEIEEEGPHAPRGLRNSEALATKN